MNDIRHGQSLTRREDDRLLAGRGRYAEDVQHPGALRAVFVRSPHASALVRSIDRSAALALPGVVAVLTGADMAADGFDDCPVPFRLPQGDGTSAAETPRPYLVRERVRCLGEPVAMVLAASEGAALDAAEQVAVEYEDQPCVVDVFAAMQPGAPQLWPDRPGNIAYHWKRGDFAQVEAALAASHHVTRLKSYISRVAAMPLEPRSALAYTGDDGRPVLRVSHQAPHALRDQLATLFGLPREGLRVIAEHVGGSFGLKWGPQREEVLVFWAARRLGRPVRWTAARTEAFLSDEHARDLFVTGELGLDADGRFTALRVRYDINVGGYMTGRSVTPIMNFGGIAGVYATPLIAGEAVGVFTHTQSTAAYRGAGRPEATYALERLIDVAALEAGIDPVELRRRNLVPPQAMPYRTPFVFTYDCGEFERNLDRALELAAYASFPARREQARLRGRLRGIGLAVPIEAAGGMGADQARVCVGPDGSVTISSGSLSVGQGHETTFAALVAQRLGVGMDRVRVLQGDTDAIADGKGNGGSSAAIMGGSAVSQGIDDLLEKARAIAARELEVSAQDLRFEQGAFRAAGTDLTVTLAALVRAVQEKPLDGSSALEGAARFSPPGPTFPNGCHVCEVEVDPATGEVRVVGYVCVEDVGRVLNPLLVEGQIHGGVAQGIGQALLEQVRHDDTGQVLTGSFMDYAMPRASDVPAMVAMNLETPTALNPLGVKGVGEAGTVGALAATMNAVCNALQPAGIRHLDMPATPLRVWQALRDAGAA